MNFAYIITILFTASALGAPQIKPGIIEMPLMQRNSLALDVDKPVNIKFLNQHREYITAKHFGKGRTLKKRQGPETPVNAYVRSGVDTIYYGTVSVGTPGQNLSVFIDTGSSEFWVNGAHCVQGCYDAWYDTDASSTSSVTSTEFTINYLDTASITGTIVQDTVSIAGLNVTNQSFGYALNVNTNTGRDPTQGLMGMAYHPKTDYSPNTVFENLYNSGQISKLIFGVYFARGSLKQTGSKLTLGNYDQELSGGTPSWNKVHPKQEKWVIEMDSIDIAGNEVVTNRKALIDTGASFILAPSKDVKSFYDQITGSAPSTVTPGYYTFPCSSIPDITFVFNSIAYSMTGGDFNLGPEYLWSSNCVGSISSYDSDDSNLWIVGNAFLKNVYSVFDMTNGLVGFTTVVGGP